MRYCACGAVLKTNGERCYECVVAIGVNAAAMLRAGQRAEAAEHLDYPSADGVVKLAVTHGGYGRAWPQRAMVTFRYLLKSGHHQTT